MDKSLLQEKVNTLCKQFQYEDIKIILKRSPDYNKISDRINKLPKDLKGGNSFFLTNNPINYGGNITEIKKILLELIDEIM